MATMKDVAKRAGVSLGTVSNVLNNHPSVKPENRARVMKAVEELDFRANMVARSLKTKSSNDIALVIPNINNPFYPELARGVEDVANKFGFQVFLCNSDRTFRKEYNYVESLLTKNINGMILVKPQIGPDEIAVIAKQMAVVLVDVGLSHGPNFKVLNVDDNGGFSQGLQLLHGHGHTRIALISGLLESLSSQTRYNTYVDFLQKHGLPLREDYVIMGDYSWSSGYKAAKIYMELDEPPTAIFAVNDLMAIGCMKALHELGLKVPDDVSVLGYDNIDMTKLCTPTLTTINQPKYELGARSVELLLECIDERSMGKSGGSTPDQEVVMPTHVVVRESVGPVKE